MAKHKHLTLDERYKIQNMLDSKESFSSIAKHLGRDRSTISKEVRNHISFKQSGCMGRPFNDCIHRTTCDRYDCPKGCPGCKGRLCGSCIRHCSKYEKEICKRHTSKPYVCNGCSNRPRCSIEKRIYSALAADQEYKLTIKECRKGSVISEEEALILDDKKHESIKIDKKCRIGRTYEDFKTYLTDNPGASIVEMDTVIGAQGGKCLLTIHFITTSPGARVKRVVFLMQDKEGPYCPSLN